MLDDALGVLLGDPLGDVVDLVLLARDGHVEAHARHGSVAFGRDGLVLREAGINPLGRQDPGAFTPLSDELSNLRPANQRNHYPFAYDNAWQLFGDARAPDLAVLHAPAHNWEERGGHRGEHGSLDVVQSRAPLIAAGPGIRRSGRVPAAARMIDVAPTLAAMAGVEPGPDGLHLPGQQGRVLDELLDERERPAHVVAFLCDGTNANVLYAMAEAGELPAVASLMAEGGWFEHGCVASFPSVTLANHATALTGVHPGTHGVLHNAFYDRRAGSQIVTNAPDRWHRAREHLSPRVQTVFQVLAGAGAAGAAVNEPVDLGATYSTFDLVRSGRAGVDAVVSTVAGDVPGATRAFADLKREYAFASAADHLAVRQVRDLWSSADAPPRFLWVNLILPDAANHAGGPYAEIGRAGLRDTDRRIGEIMEITGTADGRVAYVLLSDHGMEETDPACTGDWDRALTAAGIPFRDEGYGFVYLQP